MISTGKGQTQKTGQKISKLIKPGDILGLSGDLGTGKTQFVKGICAGLGVVDNVNSPTFIIVNEYKPLQEKARGAEIVYHFDLYRIKSTEELKEIGFEEYFHEKAICLIEWPELATNILKDNIKIIKFDFGEKENERIIILPLEFKI